MAVMIDPSSPAKMFTSVADGLNKLYEKKCKPLEVTYRFGEFYSPLLTASDFNARPMVLLIGQYSVGKTTFIRHLLGRDFPGQHIGPEPTTDRFLAVMHGPEERIIPGNTLAVQADMPFRAVNKFGAAFLNKFQASIVPAPILEEITLIDTPGILAGEKQSLGRSYDFTAVTEWFAERSDLVLLLFDAHKLDISDELKRTIQSLKAHDDKIRIVLNKADTVDGQQLMRVYGALMWSLGKVVQTPEVMRVFIGSFWERPIQNRDFENLFKAERADLFKEMHSLPRNSAFRKVNDLVKRARLAKVHAYILAHLKNEMPMFFGKSDKMSELIKNLDVEFRKIQQQFRLPPGDFPNIERFRLLLKNYDFDTFAKLNPKLIQALDDLLSVDIPNLLQQFPYGETTPQRQLPPVGATTQPTSQIPQQQQGYQTQPTQPGFGAQPTAQLPAPAPTQPNQQGFQLYQQPQQLQQPQLQQPQQPQQLQQSQQLQQPQQLQQAQVQVQQPPFNYQQPQQLQQSQQFPPQTYQPQFQPQPGFSQQPLPQQQMFQQHQQFQPQPSQSNPSQPLFHYPTQQPQLPQSQQLQPLHPQPMQNQVPSQSQQVQPPRGLPSSMSQTQDPTDSNFFQAALGVTTYQQLKDQGPPSQALSAGSFAAPNLMDTELTGRPLPQTTDQDSIVGIQNPFASR